MCLVLRVLSTRSGKYVSFEEVSICLLGISYKANSDDLRESPSLDILKKLIKLKLKTINIVEPNVDHLPGIQGVENIKLLGLKEGIENSDLIVSLVDHKEFKGINKKILEDKILLDTIGIFKS